MFDPLARPLAAAVVAGPWNETGVRGRIADALGLQRTALTRGKAHAALRRGIGRMVRSREVAPPIEGVERLLGEVFRTVADTREWDDDGEPTPPWYRLVSPNLEPEPLGRGAFPLVALGGPDEVAARWRVDPIDLAALADAQGIRARSSNPTLRHYHHRWVPKRTGVGYRLLEIPKSRLKRLQRCLLDEIVGLIPVHEAAHGFVRGRSLLGHVQPHVGQQVVITLDLKHWFWSITFGRVYGLFRRGGYRRPLARALASLAVTSTPLAVLQARPERGSDTFAEDTRLRAPHLPQGAPSSPGLANAVAWRLDGRLTGLARRWGATYSRYADDLAFSGGPELARRADRLVGIVGSIARDEGFELHERKTRIQRRGGPQRICGVVVNEHAAVPRARRKRLEATLHRAAHHGLHRAEDGVDPLPAWRGQVSWVEQLHPAHGRRLRRWLAEIERVSEGG